MVKKTKSRDAKRETKTRQNLLKRSFWTVDTIWFQTSTVAKAVEGGDPHAMYFGLIKRLVGDGFCATGAVNKQICGKERRRP